MILVATPNAYRRASKPKAAISIVAVLWLKMVYRNVVVSRTGSSDVLQVVENELRAPREGEARIKVLTAAVSRPDITVRTGQSLYGGTPLGQKVPFVAGYAVIGDVDAVGVGVTSVAIGDFRDWDAIAARTAGIAAALTGGQPA